MRSLETKAADSRFQPIKSTSGEPFDFADKTTALLACYLFGGVHWPNKKFGQILSLHCEVGQDGWRLDDLLVTFAAEKERSRLALSLKSNCQFTQRTAPKDLVEAAWRHFLGLDGGPFVRERDYWGIITAPHSPKIRSAINGLIEDARKQPPGALANRVDEEREPSPIKRDLFQSLACPSDLANLAGSPSLSEDITGLLSRFVFWECDFDNSPSTSETVAITLCQQCLRDEAREQASELWEAILRFSHEVRVKGGIIDLQKLLSEVRERFRLKAHPSFAEAWERIRSRSVSAARSVRMDLAGHPPIQREALANKIKETVGRSRTSFLVGGSGTGKSALARMRCEEAERSGSTYLWFRGRDLELPGAISLDERLNLNCDLPQLFQAAPAPSALLVLDGLEACFCDDGFHRAASLINAAALDKSGGPWRVLITCQSEDWDRVRSALRKAGAYLTREPEEVRIGNFSVAEGRQQLKAFPALSRLLFQPQVSEFILKPKIFDLLARHLTEEGAAKERLFATEADLVQWFWREVVCKDGPVSARDQFLRRLGVHQGDQLETATLIDGLGLTSSDRGVVSELVRDRILAEDTDTGSLRFDHDLLADWAREREVQRHAAALPQFLSGRLTKPLWHRALRLYGLHLLESNSTAAHWLEAYQAFKPGLAANDLGRNLLLQSAVFASAVCPCFERLWPELSKDEGAMLRDLLGQFQICATRADPELVAYYEQARPDLVVQAAAWHRTPWLADWAGLFRFLGLHLDDALGLAFEEISVLCETWLEAANPSWRSAHDAAELAIAAARSAKNSRGPRRTRRSEDIETHRAYRALLSASEAMPNEVGQIVLELSGRRLPPGIDEASLGDDEAYGIFNTPLGKRTSWPDGPRYRVKDAFRKTFLHRSNVTSLMRANPQVAAEALLALLLDMPRERNYDRHSGYFMETTDGFVNDFTLDMQFPIWFRGPFIHFFRAQPQVALQTTVRLINFATERCLEEVGRIWAPATVEIAFPSGTQEWIGNERSYFWSLEHRGTSGSVSCALMALERWLYEQMGAGQSIEPVIHHILANTRSLAFAGLLLRVGRKQPSLLSECLLPLFRVPEFHWMEAVSRPSGFDFYVGSLESGQESQARKEWYEQPHRKVDLHTFARRLFLADPKWRPIFEDMRQQWLARAASATPEKPAPMFLEAFAAAFELANYRKQAGASGETIIEYVPPARLAERDPEGVERLQERQMIGAVLWSCQGLLSGKASPSSVLPEEIWQKFEMLAHLETPEEMRGFQEVRDACCALAALLVESHREWLRGHPDKEATCMATLLQPLPARFTVFEYPGIELPTTEPNAFCAWALSTLWNESPGSRQIRAAIANLVISGSYSTLRALMVSAARYRDSLREHFQQLEWLVQGWAVARNREERQHYHQRKEFDLAKWRCQHAAMFIRGRLPCPGKTFPEAVRPDLTRPVPGHQGHTDRSDTGIDIQCLLEAYSWATDLSAARTAAERKRFIEIHSQILDCSMAAFRVDIPDDQADFYGPYEDEKMLIKTVASILLQLHDDEDASQLWRPIMELAPKSRFWGSWFLTDLFTESIEKPDLCPRLKRVWREMLDFAFQSPAWIAKPTWERRDLPELWRDLLKVESNFWSADDAETVGLLRFVSPFLERWAAYSLTNRENAVAVMSLLRSKAAGFLRCQGLLWLSKGLPVDETWEWKDETVQNSLAGLLVMLAENHGPELKNREDVRAAFLAFATRLAAQQHGVAVELLQRISRQS
jgi:hypothetical protein